MNKSLLPALLIPSLLMGIGLVLLPWISGLPAGLNTVLEYIAYPVLLVCMVMGLSYNQRRLFYVLYVTAIFFILIIGIVEPPDYFQPFDRFQFIQLALLCYLAVLLVFVFVSECALLSPRGFLRLAVCTALPVVPLYLSGNQDVVGMQWLSLAVFPEEISQRLPMPDVVVAAYVVAFWILLIMLFYRPGVAESSFFTLLLGAGIAFYSYPVMPQVEFIITLALLAVLALILRNGFQLAYRDELTGLPGRRALKEHLNRLTGQYSIAMLDIDFFKKFNDRYGHDTGDDVLKMVAGFLRKAGCSGKAYRYGGEEFTLVFQGREANDALPCLEELRKEIADARFIIRSRKRPSSNTAGTRMRSSGKKEKEKELRVTISIGVSDNYLGGEQAEDVMKSADKALYRAKRKGRNQVCK